MPALFYVSLGPLGWSMFWFSEYGEREKSASCVSCFCFVFCVLRFQSCRRNHRILMNVPKPASARPGSGRLKHCICVQPKADRICPAPKGNRNVVAVDLSASPDRYSRCAGYRSTCLPVSVLSVPGPKYPWRGRANVWIAARPAPHRVLGPQLFVSTCPCHHGAPMRLSSPGSSPRYLLFSSAFIFDHPARSKTPIGQPAPVSFFPDSITKSQPRARHLPASARFCFSRLLPATSSTPSRDSRSRQHSTAPLLNRARQHQTSTSKSNRESDLQHELLRAGPR